MISGAIIIPTLNEASTIGQTLERLQLLTSRWLIIVSDGGSTDGTLKQLTAYNCIVVSAPKGRASQMNEGALKARELLGTNGLLVFLHADTLLPDEFEQLMTNSLVAGQQWGYFELRLSGPQRSLRLIESMINRKSRLTKVGTGDQVMFFRSDFFWQLFGFPMLPLMEDVEMSRRAKALALPSIISEPVITSSRKWEQEGIWKTVLLMWMCRLAFYCGVRAATIHKWYYGK